MYRKTILINSFLAAFFALLVLSCSSDDKVDTMLREWPNLTCRPAFTMFVVVQHVAMEHGNSTLMETKARLLCRHPLRK